MGDVAKELQKLKEEGAKLTKEEEELKKLGKAAASIYKKKKDIARFKGLADRMNGCSSKQDEAGEFAEKILEKSNVDGKIDMEINDAAKRQFKKIMEQINSFHCAETEKALSGSLQIKKKKNSPFANAMVQTANTDRERATAPGQGGGLRRKRRSKKSRKRRTKCGRRKTKCKRVKRRRTKRKRKRTRRRH